MADSVEAQIAAEQAARRKADKASQRASDKASLSVKNAHYDSDIYGGSSSRGAGYDTSIAVGGSNGMDEDLDDSDRPVRLLDSCESRTCCHGTLSPVTYRVYEDHADRPCHRLIMNAPQSRHPSIFFMNLATRRVDRNLSKRARGRGRRRRGSQSIS